MMPPTWFFTETVIPIRMPNMLSYKDHKKAVTHKQAYKAVL